MSNWSEMSYARNTDRRKEYEYEKSDSKIEFYGTLEDLTRCCCYSVEDVYREIWED